MTDWDALWVNVHLATMHEAHGYGEIRDGAIAVRDGRIAWLGPRAALPACGAARTHDGKGCWLTPGLIDCHTHIVHAGNRSAEFEARLNGASYEDIARAGGGIVSTVRATRAVTEQELFDQSIPRVRALLADGVTTLEIKSGYGLDQETEAKMLRVARRIGREMPVRVRTSFLGAHALPPDYAGRADDYVDMLCEGMLPALADEGLVDAVDAYCERIGFTVSQTERLFRAARGLGLPVKLHAEQLSDQGGARLAACHHALSADHLEYLGPDGIAAMAAARTVAVLLPGAYYFLRETRLPPVRSLREQGVPIALATDCNPGTSPMASLLTAMNMGCTLFGLTPAEALMGVTRNAAQALGISGETGSLAVGKAADFALWQVERPAELAYGLGLVRCASRVVGGMVARVLPSIVDGHVPQV